MPPLEKSGRTSEALLKEYGWNLSAGPPPDAFKNDVSWPPVTVGIISYNRCEALRLTLRVLKEARYPDMEIIVVDNGSADGTVAMIRQDFTSVRLIELRENTGTAARNIFLKGARGKYIFCYDDDSVPATPGTIGDMVRFMEEHPDVAALCGNCYQPHTGIEETSGWETFSQRSTEKGFEGIFLLEGGVCLRAEFLKETGYYDEANLWGAEGCDLSLEFLKKGQLVHLNRNFTTLHFKHWAGRPPGRDTHWKTQNMIFMLAKHFPVWAFIPLSVGYVLRRMIGIAIRPKTAVGVVKGVLKGFSGAGEFLKRKPKLTIRQMLFLKRWYLMLYRW